MGSTTISLTMLPTLPMSPSAAVSHCPSLKLVSEHRRPKLTLNTRCSRKFDATSLRLDTLSASSPTVRNTHKNTSAAPLNPASAVYPLPSGSDADMEPNRLPPSQSATLMVTTPLSTESSLCCSSHLSATPVIPYARSSHLRSILVNSPLSPQTTSRNTIRPSCSSKGMYAFAKRVNFRQELPEIIQTKKYCLRHSDILTPEQSPPPTPPSKSGHQVEVKRESLSPKRSSDEDDEMQYPKTPVAGRRQKKRVWAWTLGPIDGVNPISLPRDYGDDVPDSVCSS